MADFWNSQEDANKEVPWVPESLSNPLMAYALFSVLRVYNNMPGAYYYYYKITEVFLGEIYICI